MIFDLLEKLFANVIEMFAYRRESAVVVQINEIQIPSRAGCSTDEFILDAVKFVPVILRKKFKCKTIRTISM